MRSRDWSPDVGSSDLFSGADREPIIAAQLGIPGRLGLAHRAQAVGQAGRGPDPVLVLTVPAALIMRAQMRDAVARRVQRPLRRQLGRVVTGTLDLRAPLADPTPAAADRRRPAGTPPPRRAVL